jgi:hypothetical protein
MNTYLKGGLVMPLQSIAGTKEEDLTDLSLGMCDKMQLLIAEDEANSLFDTMMSIKDDQDTVVQHLTKPLVKFVNSNGEYQAIEFVSGTHNEFHHTMTVRRNDPDFEVLWSIKFMTVEALH